MADPLRPSGPQIPGSLMGEIQSEVAVEATPLLSFVLRNSRIIVACIVLLVLVIVGVGGWQWHQGRVEREAHLELGRILVTACLQDLLHPLRLFLNLLQLLHAGALARQRHRSRLKNQTHLKKVPGPLSGTQTG